MQIMDYKSQLQSRNTYMTNMQKRNNQIIADKYMKSEEAYN